MIEEAVHLLRLMSLRITVLYFIGSIPFTLGLLYFIADMSNSAFAYQRMAEGVFSMVFLFLWMKCWQTIFCNHVRAFVSGAETPRWSFFEIIRLCITQTAVQPLVFITLPIALLITLPFGYAYAFFQNISLYGNGKTGSMKALCNMAFNQARIFPLQNHLIIFIMFVFGLFVLLNIITVMALIPYLVKTFLGVESTFTTAGAAIFNTTFFAASFGLTYLFINPIVKTIYVLRCFHGESLHTGEDLKIALRSLRPTAIMLAAFFAAIIFLHPLAPPVSAAAPVLQTPEAGLSAPALDESLSKVISKKEYAWRLPREEITKENRGPFAAFIRGVIDTVAEWFEALVEWGRKALKWIIDYITDHLSLAPRGPSDRAWTGSTQILLYALAVIAACILAIAVFRVIKKRARTAEPSGFAIPLAHDLSSEEVTADDLPTDEWLALARQMSEKGDLRLALRALYLGSLAHLAGHGIVNIARYKSNKDYEKELGRRAVHASDLATVFSKNILIFESAWYGMHDISPETYRVFNDNSERIMAIADRL
jgi:hypothetical protein